MEKAEAISLVPLYKIALIFIIMITTISFSGYIYIHLTFPVPHSVEVDKVCNLLEKFAFAGFFSVIGLVAGKTIKLKLSP